MRRSRAVLLICTALGVAGCSSSGGKRALTTTPPTPSSSSTSLPRRPASTLSFREVRDVVACEHKPQGAMDDAMRPGGDCFTLGPVLIARSNLDAASAMYDDATAQWVVDVHFADDEFLDKVAEPMIGRRIAIVVDGDVQSVPEVNPGITGRDVQISGGFTEGEARALATSLVASGATDAPS